MLDRVDAAATRHRDIHDDDVRPRVLVALIGRGGVACLADDRQPFVLRQQRAIALANDGVVVDKKDADRSPAHGNAPRRRLEGNHGLEPEAAIPEVDDVQLSAERHHTLAHSDQPNPSPAVALLRSTAPHPSSSIVSASQRGRHAAGSLRRPDKAESDARPARIRMLADVGEALLDDPIDMRRRRRRQPLEVAIDLERDLQISAGSAVPDSWRGPKGWRRARSRRSPAGEGSAGWSAAIASWPSKSARDCSASGTSAGHSLSAVALIEAATALMALRALRELVVKLARQMAPLLLLSVDEPRGQCRSLARRPVEACRQRVEDLADALKLDKPEARQPARQVTARQSIEPGKNILRGPQGAADRDVLQHADRADDQRGQAEQPRDILPDRGENGGRLGRDDQRSVRFPVIGDRTQRSRYGRREAICPGRKTRPAARHCRHSSRCSSIARCFRRP